MKSNVKAEINTFKWLLLKTHEDALVKNEEKTARWNLFRDDHESLMSRLMSFQDQLTHPIMVPIGTKALMKGSLVHTNEILVRLGDNWFTKQSAKEAIELCQRRIKSSEEMLDKLNKERDLLESRMKFPVQNDTFGNQESQEIIEPYDEESEKEWKARHRQKEQEYHQKLAELKKQQKNKIESEEDLWKRLDALDLQEELEDELNRLDEECEDDSESNETGSQLEESDTDSDDIRKEKTSEQMQSTAQVKKPQHRISFDKESDSRDDDGEPIRISFKHSDNTVPPTYQDTTPASIYTKLSECFNRVPKCILKKTKSLSVEEKIQDSVEDENKTILQDHKIDPVQVNIALSDVVERKQPNVQETTNTRPVSKFKASRQVVKAEPNKN